MRARPGVVLVGVLFTLLLLSVALAGVLTVAGHEALLGRMEAATIRARLGAEGAVRTAVAGWDGAALDTLAIGSAREAPWAAGAGAGGVRWAARVERLSASRWRVLGSATVGPADRPAARGRAALLVATVDPAGVWAALTEALAAVGAVTLEQTASVEGAPFAEPCGAAGPVVDAAGGGGPFAAVRTGPDATVTVSGGATVGGGTVSDAGVDAASLARMGPLGAAALGGSADRLEAGSLALGPAEAEGACLRDAPGNWGAPLQPAHPCAGFVPVVHAPGDLELTGGAGEAVLLVEGDLTMRAGVELRGIVLVLGRLTVEEGAVVRGAVRVAGSDVIVDGAVLRDPCALHRALVTSGLSTRPFRPAGRWWLPAF